MLYIIIIGISRRTQICNIHDLQYFIAVAVAIFVMWQCGWNWNVKWHSRAINHQDRNLKASPNLKHSRSQWFYYSCYGHFCDVVMWLKLKCQAIFLCHIPPGPEFRYEFESSTFKVLDILLQVLEQDKWLWLWWWQRSIWNLLLFSCPNYHPKGISSGILDQQPNPICGHWITRPGGLFKNQLRTNWELISIYVAQYPMDKGAIGLRFKVI